MSAKHEKDYEYPLQINGRRVGNTTRLVDWMVQRWFMDGGVELVGSPFEVMKTLSKFKNRMASEHYTLMDHRINQKPDDGSCRFTSFPAVILDGPDMVTGRISCVIPNNTDIKTSHD